MNSDNPDLYDTNDENTKAKQEDDEKEVGKEEESNEESNDESAPTLTAFKLLYCIQDSDFVVWW